MFDAIAPRYDLLNHVLSAGMDRGWRDRAVDALALSPGARVLDLCTGTGDLAIAIVHRVNGATVVGVDFAGEMLRLGAGEGERRVARATDSAGSRGRGVDSASGSFVRRRDDWVRHPKRRRTRTRARQSSRA